MFPLSELLLSLPATRMNLQFYKAKLPPRYRLNLTHSLRYRAVLYPRSTAISSGLYHLRERRQCRHERRLYLRCRPWDMVIAAPHVGGPHGGRPRLNLINTEPISPIEMSPRPSPMQSRQQEDSLPVTPSTARWPQSAKNTGDEGQAQVKRPALCLLQYFNSHPLG